MSIFIEEDDCGTIKAIGCHDDLWQEDVQIDAEYTAGEKRCGDNRYDIPSTCEITALYIRIRRMDEPVKIDRCHFGENVIRQWESEIIDEIESEER